MEGVEVIQGIGFNISFLNTHSELADILRSGEFEGVPFKLIHREIINGDSYLAQRNVATQLLTALNVDVDNNWVVPVEMAYSYNIGECIPIELEL